MSGYPPLVTTGNIGNVQVKTWYFHLNKWRLVASLCPKDSYARIRNRNLEREQAIIEKEEMIEKKKKKKRKMDHWSKMSDHYANRTKAVERYQNSYRKNRTLENADRLSAALDGRL